MDSNNIREHMDVVCSDGNLLGSVDRSRSGLEKSIQNTKGLELFSGTAAFTGPNTLSINGETLSAEHIFINTGARPMIPGIPGRHAVDGE